MILSRILPKILNIFIGFVRRFRDSSKRIFISFQRILNFFKDSQGFLQRFFRKHQAAYLNQLRTKHHFNNLVGKRLLFPPDQVAGSFILVGHFLPCTPSTLVQNVNYGHNDRAVYCATANKWPKRVASRPIFVQTSQSTGRTKAAASSCDARRRFIGKASRLAPSFPFIATRWRPKMSSLSTRPSHSNVKIVTFLRPRPLSSRNFTSFWPKFVSRFFDSNRIL